MAKRGSTKQSSIDHEEYIAGIYRGRRSPSSGAADNDNGDVRSENYLIECKTTGRPGYPVKSLPVFVQTLEKIADEAWAEGRFPVLAMRFYNPDSPLAVQGWVDVSIMISDEHATLEAL